MKQILFYALIVIVLSACNKVRLEGNENEVSDKKTIVFLPEIGSRAAMEQGFVDDDIIGIFMGKNEDDVGTFMWNFPCWFDEHNRMWKGPYDIFWESEEIKMNVVAYYPYSFLNRSQDLNSLRVSLPYEQSSIDSLRKADFLWARIDGAMSATYPDGIPLDMSHLLCKLKFNMYLTVEGQPSTDVPFIQLYNVKNEGWIDLNTGGVITDNDVANNVTMYYDADKRMAEAIVFPQTLEAGKLMHFMMASEDGNVAYGYRLDEPLKLEGGKEYVLDYKQDFEASLFMPYDSVYCLYDGQDIESDFFYAYLNGVQVLPDEVDPFVGNLKISIEKSEGSDWFNYKFENGRFHFGIEENLTPDPREGKIFMKVGSLKKYIKVCQDAVYCEKITRSLTYKEAVINSYEFNRLDYFTDVTCFIEYNETDNVGWVRAINLNGEGGDRAGVEVDENLSTTSRSCVVSFLHRGVLPVMVLNITQYGRTE